MEQSKDQVSGANGKTYTLISNESASDQYYNTIRGLAELFLQQCTDAEQLIMLVRKAGETKGSRVDTSLASLIKKTLKESLSKYTLGVQEHLTTLPSSKKSDEVLLTSEEQYHLYMLEIELVNRINIDAFKKSEYKFALIAHCLRDFRPECRADSGDIESICTGCTEDCFINIGSTLLEQHNIHPYISVSMDLDKLFMKLKSEHPSIGALGISCVPELALGMRLCTESGIYPVGVPLDANRCARWMEQCRESSFNLEELDSLLK